MRKAIIVIGVTIAMLIGIGIAGAQTPTPTPEPTPTPTVTDIVCEELWWLSFFAETELGYVSADPKDATKSHTQMYNTVNGRLENVLAFTEEPDPLLHRLVKPMWAVYEYRNTTMASWLAATLYGDGPELAFLSARQLERLCGSNAFDNARLEEGFDIEAYKPAQYDFEVLVDFGCSTYWAVVNSPYPNVNPRFASQFTPFRCNNQRYADANHSHYEYAEKNHTHGGW